MVRLPCPWLRHPPRGFFLWVMESRLPLDSVPVAYSSVSEHSHTASGLLLLLRPALVPVPVPSLLCLTEDFLGPVAILALIRRLLWVRVPCMRICGRNHLVSLMVLASPLGCLPGTGLLLLMIRDIILSRTLRISGCHNVVSE